MVSARAELPLLLQLRFLAASLAAVALQVARRISVSLSCSRLLVEQTKVHPLALKANLRHPLAATLLPTHSCVHAGSVVVACTGFLCLGLAPANLPRFGRNSRRGVLLGPGPELLLLSLSGGVRFQATIGSARTILVVVAALDAANGAAFASQACPFLRLQQRRQGLRGSRSLRKPWLRLLLWRRRRSLHLCCWQ